MIPAPLPKPPIIIIDDPIIRTPYKPVPPGPYTPRPAPIETFPVVVPDRTPYKPVPPGPYTPRPAPIETFPVVVPDDTPLPPSPPYYLHYQALGCEECPKSSECYGVGSCRFR